jgi:hypothetical protein
MLKIEAAPAPVSTTSILGRKLFDYFLKDHVGSVRAVITEESKTDAYPALSFEGTSESPAGKRSKCFLGKSNGRQH